jgi:hypothetical protein
MPELQDVQTLNPQVREVTIGKKYLRKIQMFPLSAGDQLKFNDFLAEIGVLFLQVDTTKQLSAAFFSVLLEKIKEKIGVFCFMLFEVEDIINEITNDQAVEIAKIVYEVNYAGLAKNVQSLFGTGTIQKVLDGLGLERPPSPSVDTSPVTPSETSSTEGGPKVV